MRDPDRIPAILQRIEQVWERYPDLRLGQLLINVFSGDRVALYSTEDEQLANQIEWFYEDLEDRFD